VLVDGKGNPVLYGDVSEELKKEQAFFSKIFDFPLNPAFFKGRMPDNPAAHKLQSLSDFCRDQGIALTK
jgi:hypothetical protein